MAARSTPNAEVTGSNPVYRYSWCLQTQPPTVHSCSYCEWSTIRQILQNFYSWRTQPLLTGSELLLISLVQYSGTLLYAGLRLVTAGRQDFHSVRAGLLYRPLARESPTDLIELQLEIILVSWRLSYYASFVLVFSREKANEKIQLNS
jgi:hypothetical protein